MRILRATAEFLGVNCWAIAPDEGHECVLFDAGLDGSAELSEILAEEELTPAALILTHGHPDHILGLPMFADAFGDLPVHLHEADLYRLSDPAGTMSPQFKEVLEPFVRDWQAPSATPLTDGDRLCLAGLEISIVHTPGHTEGSCVFPVIDPAAQEDDAPVQEAARILMTGDVLFAGSIGRTDLPGSDPAAMASSLQTVRALPNSAVYPGHGPATLLSHELRVNPFL